MIYPTIVMDWEKSEAYLLIELNDVLMEEPFISIQEKNISNGRKYEYVLNERGRENMLEFATKIYEGIVAENEIAVKVGSEYQLLFPSDEDKENFRIVMGDYYRLTSIF